MNLSLPAFLDIAIGLTFIYLILSLLASEIQELIAAFLQFRAKHLKKSIYIMLGGTDNSKAVEQSLKGLNKSEHSTTPNPTDHEKAINLTNKLYENSLIASLTQSNLGFSRKDDLTNLLYGPSYIPSETFASALVDILELKLDFSTEESIIDKIKSSFQHTTVEQNETKPKIPEKLKHNLCELAVRAKLKAENLNKKELETYQFKKEIEEWYNRSQNRTSGTYKRNSKFVLFWIGLITAGFANANAFHIVSSLYHQGTVRNAVTQAAVNAVNDCRNKEDAEKQECLNDFKSNMEETDRLPIGWDFSSPSPASSTDSDSPTTSSTASSLEQIKFQLIQLHGLAIHLLGWVVSALAIMMGAPFWFDLLNKFVNVRNAGPKPPSSTES